MRVNEIFYSVQGEGYHAGNAAIFVRLSGCNIRCSFCDTIHQPYEVMTEEMIVDEISKYPSKLVIITGGEPTLQLTHSLVDKIHAMEKKVAIETNGTREIPDNVDWITVSPKYVFVGKAGKPTVKIANEVKIVFDDVHHYDDPTFGITAEHYYVQPCDTGNFERNSLILEKCINFIKNNPSWKISIQQQKILNVR